MAIHRFFKYFQIFKVIRIFRIGTFISQLHIDKQKKAFLKVLKLIFYVFMYLHVLTCFWYIIISYNTPKMYFLKKEGYY